MTPEHEQALFAEFEREAEKRVRDRRPVINLRLAWLETWLLLTLVNLAAKHPNIEGPAAEYARHLASVLARHCATTPALAKIAQTACSTASARGESIEDHPFTEATLP